MQTQNTYFLIHWRSPREQIPEEASYVLIRQDFGDGEIFCSEAAYEQGAYWSLLMGYTYPIDVNTITGWSYLPYDDRNSMSKYYCE